MSDTLTTDALPTAVPTAERRTLLPSVSELNRMIRLAEAYAQAGMARNTGEALAKIQAGWELGAGPGTAMTEIAIIDGQGGRKISLSPLLMRALVRTHGLGVIDPIKQDAETCVCKITRNDWPADRTEFVTFNVDDAIAAELMIRNAKGEATAHPKHKNYDRYRPDMFLARASARAWRRHFPELAAGLPYCAEELGADVDESGRPHELAELPAAASLPTLPTSIASAVAPAPGPQPVGNGDPLQPLHNSAQAALPAGGQNQAANAAEPVAAGLQAIETDTLARERAAKLPPALALLKWDAATWRQFLQHHFGKQKFAELSAFDQGLALAQLTRLHKCELLRAECKIDAAAWTLAKSKRGVEYDWQLTPDVTQQIVNKLADSLSPFRRQELGLVEAALGVAAPNAPAPATGDSPAPAPAPAAAAPQAPVMFPTLSPQQQAA